MGNGKERTGGGGDEESGGSWGSVLVPCPRRSCRALGGPRGRRCLQDEVWCYLKLSVLSEKSVDSWTRNMCLHPTLV